MSLIGIPSHVSTAANLPEPPVLAYIFGVVCLVVFLLFMFLVAVAVCACFCSSVGSMSRCGDAVIGQRCTSCRQRLNAV